MKYIYILLSLLIFSCSPSKENNTPNTTFQIDPNQRNIIQGSQGGILIIPANSFVDEQGNNIATEIEVHLTEAYQLKDIIKHNLQTVADDRLLVTGGMINLEVTADNNPVQIATDKEITYQRGIAITDTNTYQFFTMSDNNWDKPQPPNPYLTYFPIEAQTSYVCGWASDTTINDLEFVENGITYTNIRNEKIKHGYRSSPDTIPIFNKYAKELLPSTIDINNTFLASQEFTERYQASHVLQEGAFLILAQVYYANLDKPLWFVDSLYINKLREHSLFDAKSTSLKELLLQYEKKCIQFKNQRKTTFRENRLTLEERKKLQAFYEKLKTEETKSNTMYSFSVRSTGWHNIDYYYKKTPLLPTQLTITANETIEKSILILKDVPVVLYGTKQQDGSFVFNQKLPHTDAYLVSIGFKGEQILLNQKEIIIGQNKTEKITLESSSKGKMEQILQNIEQGFDFAN